MIYIDLKKLKYKVIIVLNLTFWYNDKLCILLMCKTKLIHTKIYKLLVLGSAVTVLVI